jgi:hypothetical protein
MIERERAAAHGDPETEARLAKLAEEDSNRARYQEMAAEDLIGFDELRACIAELDETRRTADRELRDLCGRQEHIRQLEQVRGPARRLRRPGARGPG